MSSAYAAAAAAASVGVVTPLYINPSRITGSISAGKASHATRGKSRSGTGVSTGKLRRRAVYAISPICATPSSTPGMTPPRNRYPIDVSETSA